MSCRNTDRRDPQKHKTRDKRMEIKPILMDSVIKKVGLGAQQSFIALLKIDRPNLCTLELD